MTTVGFQGEPGAFGEEAVVGWFGAAVTAVPMPTFSAVCAAVESGRTDAGARRNATRWRRSPRTSRTRITT